MNVQKIKYRLMSLRQEIDALDATNEQAASTVELDQTRVGRLSRMDALQAQAISQESRRRRLAMKRRIGPALARLESGDYGYCQDCDELISDKRLEFDPTCELCIECAQKRE